MLLHFSERIMATLVELGAAARPINDVDWGSDRQITAQNRFFDRVYQCLTETGEAAKIAQLDAYCHKATTNEMIDEGMRLVLGDSWRTHVQNLT
jgi:hypothetical protein